MFHAGQSTKHTGLGMYGATLDSYKVGSKLYTIPKMLSSVFRSFSAICFYETK